MDVAARSLTTSKTSIHRGEHLRDAKSSFKIAVDSSPDLVFRWEPDGCT
jgi:hypothetical protein